MLVLADIRSAILPLDLADREEFRRPLPKTTRETPAMLAALDEGLRSVHAKGVISREDVRRRLSAALP